MKYIFLFCFLIGCASRPSEPTVVQDPQSGLLLLSPNNFDPPISFTSGKIRTIEVIDSQNRFSFACPTALREKFSSETVTLCGLSISVETGTSFEQVAENLSFETRPDDPTDWRIVGGRSSSDATEFKNGPIRALYGYGDFGCHDENGYAGLATWVQALITNGKKTYSLSSESDESQCLNDRDPISTEELQVIVESFKFHGP